MDRPLSILLIEDEPLECQEIIKCVETNSDVELIGITNNIEKALEHVKESMPDAVILDLELHNGYGNGLTFLNLLKKMQLPAPLYVLVTTNNISYITHESARKTGADFIMLKSQQDYSAKTVVEFLHSQKNIIQGNKQVVASSNQNYSSEQKEQILKLKIVTELEMVGIPPNAVGRKYLIDSILLIVNGQAKKIHSLLAEKYKMSASSIERAMQIAIAKAWRTSDIDDLERHYTARISSARGVPTVMEFIHYYADKINL